MGSKKIKNYSHAILEWTLKTLGFTETIYGKKLSYDQKNTPHADMRSATFIITQPVD